MKKIISIILALCMSITLFGCSGGKSDLSLKIDQRIILENGKMRAVINKQTGGISELYNKEADLYLTKDGAVEDMAVIRMTYIGNAAEQYESPKTFSYEVAEDSADLIKLCFTWGFDTGHTASAEVSLAKDSGELIFNNLHIGGNSAGKPVYAVEYPIINGIKSLDSKEKDCFLSPFVTGYVFHNPVENFNGDYQGIGRTDGFYPSGWEYPMQFQAYYSQDEGGFYMQTEDSSDGMKSFTFTGQDGDLRASVWHFAQNFDGKDIQFGYDTVIANLTRGTWYEAADRYKEWAIQQPWCVKGKNVNRSDINKEFYENTTLTNFCFLNDNTTGTERAYELMKSEIPGEYLFITLSGTTIAGGNADERVYQTWLQNAKTTNFYNMMDAYGDRYIMFEFPSFYLKSQYNNNQTFIDNAMINYDESEYYYYNWEEVYYEICPSCDEYTLTQLSKDQIYVEQANFGGIYHDVGFAAGLPKQCFDKNHAHGNRINIVGESKAQMKIFSDYARSKGGVYGQELISEQYIPYIDFYQTRANAQALSQMEAMRILNLVENGSAEKVHLFEYVYKEYTGVRLDGYMIPETSMGGAYYHTMAFTALNGGIPEYNYENTLKSTRGYPLPEYYDEDMLAFAGELAAARMTYGKDFLVWGEMMPAPTLNTGKTEYDYYVYRMDAANIRGQDYSGTTAVDSVVVSAFQYNGKIALFLCNITENDIAFDFDLNTGSLYGVDSGVIASGQSGYSAVINNGIAELNLPLPSRKVVMLTFDA